MILFNLSFVNFWPKILTSLFPVILCKIHFDNFGNCSIKQSSSAVDRSHKEDERGARKITTSQLFPRQHIKVMGNKKYYKLTESGQLDNLDDVAVLPNFQICYFAFVARLILDLNRRNSQEGFCTGRGVVNCHPEKETTKLYNVKN